VGEINEVELWDTVHAVECIVAKVQKTLMAPLKDLEHAAGGNLAGPMESSQEPYPHC
jgi:hypothetical protein